jgi:hypothetical protein
MALTSWISKASRAGGEYNSPNYAIPQGVNNLRLQLNVDADVFEDDRRSVTLEVQVSDNGAASWSALMLTGWTGGPLPTPRPGQTAGWFAGASGLAQHAGMLVRVHASSSGSFTWGMKGELS